MIDYAAREFAYVSVWSKTLSADQVSLLLGLEADHSWSVGEVFTRDGRERLRSATSWDLGPLIAPTCPIEDQLNSLRERADSVLSRVDPTRADVGCGLVIVQNLSTDEDERHGLTIGESWTELLGRCGGRIIIDQYVG